MSLWQSTMIGLARSKSVTRFMQGNAFTRSLASRFVGGDSAPAAIRRGVELSARKIGASLYYLGEYIESPDAIEENVSQITAIIRQLGQSKLDVHISIDPTQIGYAHSDTLGEANALRIGQVIAEQPAAGRRLLMLDMEDFSVVQKTLDLRARLAQAGCPTAITIQAYLHRSGQDLCDLVEGGAAGVRLVKGAFAESKDRAWTDRSDISREYLNLASYLLSADSRSRGVTPIFATHDDALIKAIMGIAEQNLWSRDDYEFEMLYGVRTPLQEEIVAAGCRLRLYLPFGTQWWPYTVRRIGENPANARFVLYALWNRPSARR
ncbi:MAG TPA: proline dehydrogenase family protein [Aggregatilineales bacterium]|nr:proline dehydrogenase family protein [Aggregatilineales bacterium]